MNRLSLLLKVTLIISLCFCVSSCTVEEDNKTPSPNLIESPVITPSIVPELIYTPVPTAEPLISNLENENQAVIGYIKGNSVNFREAPELDSHIILSLNDNTRVEVIENEGIWSMVKYKDEVGYIHNDYLSDTISAQGLSLDTVSITERIMPDRLSSPIIIVKKSERILELWDGDKLFDSYFIGLGWEPDGDKKREGDGRTPEGSYYVCIRNSNSRFYLSLGVSYPNSEDAKEALDDGTIDRNTYDQIVSAIDEKSCPPWNTALGGEIMIHGMGSNSDWTAGCIAVNNDVMDILWKYCPLKTPIIIES